MAEKILPKIHFKLLVLDTTKADAHDIILDRNGVKEILGSWDNYETEGERTTWYNRDQSVLLMAANLTPKNIDDFINDDVRGGFGAGFLGGALLGGALLGGLALASGPGYGYGYPAPYPVAPYYVGGIYPTPYGYPVPYGHRRYR